MTLDPKLTFPERESDSQNETKAAWNRAATVSVSACWLFVFNDYWSDNKTKIAEENDWLKRPPETISNAYVEMIRSMIISRNDRVEIHVRSRGTASARFRKKIKGGTGFVGLKNEPL